MKIKNIDLSGDIAIKYGLKAITMTRLGKVVLIAGKNGAGKTRLLRAIQEVSDWRYENRSVDVHSLSEQISNLRAEIDQERDYGKQYELNRTVKALQSEKAMKLALTATAGPNIRIPLVRFLPKCLNISPRSEQTLGMISARAAEIREVGTDSLAEGAFSYLYTRQRSWHEATHAYNRSHLNSNYRDEAISSYNALQGLLSDILDTRLTRSEDGFPCLFGHSLDSGNFSEGQKVLLQLAVALHAQDRKLNDVILLLDEPETHLHPSALIEIIDRLRDKIEAGQIWICTHSIPLIAHIAAVDPYAVWHMENQGIVRAGRRPELILESLLGKREIRGNLEDFMRLPHDLALANFAAQSLVPPQAVETGSGDPQLVAISKVINELNKYSSKFRVLDYGAGKGRLLGGLVARYGDIGVDPTAQLDYYAYDEYADDKKFCEAVIASSYGSSEDRYYNSFDELSLQFSHSFDVVVMTNVLHEIHPSRWNELFSKNGIPSLLKPAGALLLVEDQKLPVGEKAHQFGFILLDTSQLRTLFDVSGVDEEKSEFVAADVRGDGRIKLHLISANLLSRFNEEKQQQAIYELGRMARKEIEKLRSKDKPSYDDGQLHGLWTQLYTNASLFLESKSVS